jgi:hypothetical protein
MSGSGDVQPSQDYQWTAMPAIWGSVTAGDNLTLFTPPDFTAIRIDYAALTIRYRWEDQMTEAELQYGNVDTGDRGAILAVAAFSNPSFTEFVYQQRYQVSTEQPIFLSHGDALQSLYIDSATSNPLGGISFINAFVAYSQAQGPYGTF